MKNLLPAALFLLLAACGEQPPALSRLPDHAVILAFGDSLTYGTGVPARFSYPSILSEQIALEVINEGQPGEISRDGAARLPALLDEYHPNLMILIHGGNDMLKKIPFEETAANLNKMVEAARQRNIETILLGVPGPNLFRLKSADFYQALAETHQIPVDLDTLPEILSNSNLKSDPIHPNANGYRLIAENIAALMVQTGALSSH